MDFIQRLQTDLDERRAQGNFRELPLISYRKDAICFDSQRFIDLASNDYLCVARDNVFLNEFFSTITDDSSGCEYAHRFLSSLLSSGSTGSRLLTGNHLCYAYCENLLASLFNGACCDHELGMDLSSSDLFAQHAPAAVTEETTIASVGFGEHKPTERRCLYLNSGFDANAGILSTLFNEHDLLLVDKLAHASIIDGMLKSPAKSMRFAHNDMEHLASLLEKHAGEYENVVIVTESVFSMDGDQAKLKEIVAFKEQYDNVMVYVDEAHAFGLFGEGGLGLCQELGILPQVDFIMGTLSKAIGSQGAFFICAPTVREYLVNYMRPLIFSTALPPFNVTFSMYVIGMLKTTAFQSKREYLKRISHYLHSSLQEEGMTPSESQIQPLLTGTNENAVKASEVFAKAGLLAMPIRYPTVPKNKARLRLSLNCNLRIDDIEQICQLVKRYRSLFL